MKKFEVGKTYEGTWHSDDGTNSGKYYVIKRSEKYVTFQSEYEKKRVIVSSVDGKEVAMFDHITFISA